LLFCDLTPAKTFMTDDDERVVEEDGSKSETSPLPLTPPSVIDTTTPSPGPAQSKPHTDEEGNPFLGGGPDSRSPDGTSQVSGQGKPDGTSQASGQGKYEKGYVVQEEQTSEEHAALLAKFAQYEAERVASQAREALISIGAGSPFAPYEVERVASQAREALISIGAGSPFAPYEVERVASQAREALISTAASSPNFAQYEAERVASQAREALISTAASSPNTVEVANYHAPVPQPPPPLPPVSPIDYSLYVGPGIFWQTYQGSIRDMWDSNNPTWARITFGALATLMSPMALAEKYFGRSLANVPFAVKNYGMYIGEYGARSYLNFARGETGEGVIDALNAVGSFAVSFTQAAQGALAGRPVVSALKNFALSVTRRVEQSAIARELTSVPGEIETTLPPELNQTMPPSTSQSLPKPRIIDNSVLAKAMEGHPKALEAIDKGPAVVTLTQLREFLIVDSEIAQVQRAQFLLDKEIVPLSTRFGQLNNPDLKNLFWEVANRAKLSSKNPTADGALVVHGLQSKGTVVTGDTKLINTVLHYFKKADVPYTEKSIVFEPINWK
jgi:hypothetical protein